MFFTILLCFMLGSPGDERISDTTLRQQLSSSTHEDKAERCMPEKHALVSYKEVTYIGYILHIFKRLLIKSLFT